MKYTNWNMSGITLIGFGLFVQLNSLVEIENLKTILK